MSMTDGFGTQEKPVRIGPPKYLKEVHWGGYTHLSVGARVSADTLADNGPQVIPCDAGSYTDADKDGVARMFDWLKQAWYIISCPSGTIQGRRANGNWEPAQGPLGLVQAIRDACPVGFNPTVVRTTPGDAGFASPVVADWECWAKTTPPITGLDDFVLAQWDFDSNGGSGFDPPINLPFYAPDATGTGSEEFRQFGGSCDVQVVSAEYTRKSGECTAYWLTDVIFLGYYTMAPNANFHAGRPGWNGIPSSNYTVAFGPMEFDWAGQTWKLVGANVVPFSTDAPTLDVYGPADPENIVYTPTLFLLFEKQVAVVT